MLGGLKGGVGFIVWPCGEIMLSQFGFKGGAMELEKPRDLFLMSPRDAVTKRNLYDLIQYSKVSGSRYWAGPEWQIFNTPQQGINWVGEPPFCRAVIIKNRPGSYDDDGWEDAKKTRFNYSFKARDRKVNYSEKANVVLIRQPQYKYPIFLFSEYKNNWRFEGLFSVSGIQDKYVVLERGQDNYVVDDSHITEVKFHEGGRKYVTHLMVERNQSVVKKIKEDSPWVCDICDMSFNDVYGVPYIEAHHKVPISRYGPSSNIEPSDFALLCPNCHRAVHIYMEKEGLEYSDIKIRLRANQG